MTSFRSLAPSRRPFRRSGVDRQALQGAEVLEDRVLLTPSPNRPQDLTGFQAGKWITSIGNTTNTFTTSQWAQWANIAWNFVGQGDFNGDGLSDVIGLFGGSWYVGLSNGINYGSAPYPKWAQWANIAWQDVRIGDLNGDGRDDIFGRAGNEYYTALSNGTSFGNPVFAGRTGGLTFQTTLLADVNADGRDDFVAFTTGGNWIVGASLGGGAFGTGVIWALWDTATPWDGLAAYDMNGDGRTDVVGFRSGQWQVGISSTSSGGSFNTIQWARWASTVWDDARLGDFDGNGVGDIAARYSGQWWVGLGSLPGNNLVVNTSYWAGWSNSVVWQDVRVGDFNGDGRDDIAGRYNNQWYVSRSFNDNTFVTGLWGAWSAAGTWLGVATVQVNNFPASAASRFSGFSVGTASPGSASAADSESPLGGASVSRTGGSVSGAVSAAAVAAAQPDPLLLFWSQANRDDEWDRALLAAGV